MNKKFDLVQRVDFIKKMCSGKKVLHLGCTDFPFTKQMIENKMLLHFELEKVAGELYGFDFDQKGIDVLRDSGGTNLYRADLEKLEEVDLNENFDVIIAGEMIEHLSNPGLFLRGIKRFMNNETKLVITTVNAYCALRFIIYSLRGKGGENEPVHPDHVAYYSYKTLNLILQREKLNVEKFLFYDLGRDHRQFNRRVYNFMNDVCVKISPQLSDGVIAVCKLNKD
ncbi:MAG: class I SAM-dependent methyltransferase [Acidobacteria bacterium]|nr:class I SAM-dependent methyltransferase [Acidobacteriota bacterium]MCA1639132.1 class I SAM-dependent methyltransferase [Acidobacteriota bacterium]